MPGEREIYIFCNSARETNSILKRKYITIEKTRAKPQEWWIEYIKLKLTA